MLRSRAAILDGAASLFLRDGFTATTMDEIAMEAKVSKRTVYNNFADKEELFRRVVLAAIGTAEEFSAQIAEVMADPDDLTVALTGLATRLAERVTDLRIVRLRRLLIGEAHRFPDLAVEYYRVAPGRVVTAFADVFESLARRGRLDVSDPHRAAEHFAYLVIGASLDRAMFDSGGGSLRADSTAEAARAGVRVFLAAYGPSAHRDPA